MSINNIVMEKCPACATPLRQLYTVLICPKCSGSYTRDVKREVLIMDWEEYQSKKKKDR